MNRLPFVVLGLLMACASSGETSVPTATDVTRSTTTPATSTATSAPIDEPDETTHKKSKKSKKKRSPKTRQPTTAVRDEQPKMPPVVNPGNVYSEAGANMLSSATRGDLERVYVPTNEGATVAVID